MIITVAEFRTNSRIDADVATNAELQDLIDVAEQSVQNMLRRDWASLVEQWGDIPAPVKHACLIVANDFYLHRGDNDKFQTYSNGNLDRLLRPYVELFHGNR